MENGTDYSKMTRDELNNVAGEKGIPDAASYANKAELIAAIEAAPVDEATADGEEEAESADDAESDSSGEKYDVLKAVTDEDGRTYLPGETITLGSHWPSRRAKQLQDQGFLRPTE